ncbi:MAG: tetratricopeptide repeat protein [Myxococcaceae bacterium]
MSTSKGKAVWRACALTGLLAAACTTTPDRGISPDHTPDIPEGANPAVQQVGAETPEVYQPGDVQVVKTHPAPGSEVTAVEQPRSAPVDSAAREAFERGVAASRAGNLTAAEAELKAAIDRDGTLAYAWTNLGVVYERRGDTSAAQSAYQKALEIEPDQEMAWDYLTRLRCRTGKASDVEARLRMRIAASPAAIGPRTALVYALIHQKKYETAANEAKKVLKADERNVRAMQLLAQVYFREKKFELAKMVLENAKNIAPHDPATWHELGLVHLALESKPQAMEAFRQATALQPDFAEANNNYGALLNEAQDYQTAVRVLEAAVAAAPEFAAARLNLGNAYRGKGDFKKAIAEYQQVLRLRPDWVETYYNLAILHLDSELPDLETIPRLKQAISLFESYRSKGGKDARVEQYVKDASKGIEKEVRRLERLEKDKLRKAEEQARKKTTVPASKLGGDEPAQVVPAQSSPGSSKLGEDDK